MYLKLKHCFIFITVLIEWTQLKVLSSNIRPNVVIFIADDLGIGDVGCFGNSTIKTPNIDNIGRNGAILNHHLAADSLCTPSRAALLTGRYPIRSGMACHNDAFPVLLFVSSKAGLPNQETTIGKLAKTEGYSTAFFGKWHLGLNCHSLNDSCHHPSSHGFDTFYGFPMSNLADFGPEGGALTGYSNLKTRGRNALGTLINSAIISTIISIFLAKTQLARLRTIIFMNILWMVPVLATLWHINNLKFLNSMIMRNFDIVEQPIRFENLTQRLVLESTAFLEKEAKSNQPFLMIVSWYQVHVVLHSSDEFKGRSVHGQYGDNVEEMDWGIGKIIEALERHSQLDNTLVYFTSDNGGSVTESGPGGGSHGGYNGIFRGTKGQSVMEGGIRVPAVVMWKNHIKPGTIIDHPTSLMDVLPTLRDSIFLVDKDLQKALPDTDGRNIYPLLAGLNKTRPHEYIFHYCCREVQAVRYTPVEGRNVYKAYYATPNVHHDYCPCDQVTWHNPPLLYNIGIDPSEENSEIKPADPTYMEIMEKIETGLNQHKNSINKESGMRESQMNLLNMLPRPWLQPCCNFPFCKCYDPVYPDLKEY